MVNLNPFRRRRNKTPAAETTAPAADPATEPDATAQAADSEDSDCSPGRNYGKLVIPTIAAMWLTYHFASPYVSKTISSIKGGDRKTEQKGNQNTIETKTIACKDRSVIIFDPSKPGHYKCDEPKPETPAESDLEKKTNENATSTVSIEKTVSTASEGNYAEPGKAGKPYILNNKIVQEIDGVLRAKEISPSAYKGVMAEESLQFSPNGKHVAWFTWFSPTNSRGNVYVADVSFDENGELHVYKEDIRPKKVYQELTGPRVTEISWKDNGNLKAIKDVMVRQGRYGLKTVHKLVPEVIPIR